MRIRTLGLILIMAATVFFSGCLLGLDRRSETHQSSSLVGFLYPDGKTPPREDTIPELRVPLRVGLAFLPSQTDSTTSIDAAHRDELLGRIRQRFADRKFVSEIVVIPDYYLKTARGFAGLEGVQRLYNVDLMALVSYDQVTHHDENNWSLGYLTIIGAYVLKGNRHEMATLVDLAVVDPVTRSLVLRAGGTDLRHGNTTLVDQDRETRSSSVAGFGVATDQMVENFDMALRKFETDVREGRANVRVVKRGSEGRSSGGGAFGLLSLGTLLATFSLRTFLKSGSLPVASSARRPRNR